MIGPNLFIGVGGSGRSTLHWLYGDLRRRLIEMGWPWAEREALGRAMPECWRFLAIDVDSNENPSTDPVVPNGAINRLSLSGSPDNLKNIYGAMYGKNVGLTTLGWVPPLTDLKPFNPYDGAGQYRAIGRSVALARLDELKNVITVEAAKLNSPMAQADADLLVTSCGAKVSKLPKDRRVILVSSLSGGSGSGIWLDVAQWLTGRPDTPADAWMAHRLYSFLYLPEVYELISGADAGIAPNSMLGVVELLSACGDRAPVDRMTEPWANAMGIAPASFTTKSPRNIFFVGGRNAGVNFDRLEDVYASTAQTLAALVVGGDNSSNFDRISVNNQSTSIIPMLQAANVPSSNVGYSRLDLGHRDFGEYAGRRLFREIMRTLHNGHAALALNDYENDEQIVQRLVDEHQGRFFNSCGLYELDVDATKHDQILLGLLPIENRQTFFDELKKLLRVKTVALKKLKKENLRLPDLKRAISDNKEKVTREATALMVANIESYGATVRKQVLHTVAEYCTTFSVPVTIELLKRLDKQLGSAAIELAHQMGTADASSLDNLSAFLSKWTVNDAPENENEDSAVDHLRGSMQSQVRAVAIAFIRDVRSGLLKPLQISMERWLKSSKSELLDSWWRATVLEWNGIDVPSDLLPLPNTILIHGSDGFPDTFVDLLHGLFQLQDEASLKAAVAEIVLQSWPNAPVAPRFSATKDTDQMFVTESASFGIAVMPPASTPASEMNAKYAEAHIGFLTTSRAQLASYTMPDLVDLNESVRQWINRREGVLSTYVRLGLGKWLDQNDPDFTDRRQVFETRLSTAVARATPVITFDAGALQAVHGMNRPKEEIVASPYFPFPSTSIVANIVRSVVQSNDLDPASVDFKTGAGDPSRVEFIRSYTDGLHPLALASLTSPVTNAIAGADRNFWLARRTRPLAQSLGLTPAQIVAFARGWLVLLSLNLIDCNKGRTFLDSKWVDIPRDRIARGQKPSNFADGPSVVAATWLRIALESLAVRLFKYPSNPTSLDWYVKVLALGGYVDGDQTARDQETLVSSGGIESVDDTAPRLTLDALSAWIDSGTKHDDAPTPFPETAGSAEQGDGSVRRERLLRFLDTSLEARTDWIDQALSGPFPLKQESISASSELALHFIRAMEQVRAVVAGTTPISIPSPGPHAV
jgi:hypothetical protein